MSDISVQPDRKVNQPSFPESLRPDKTVDTHDDLIDRATLWGSASFARRCHPPGRLDRQNPEICCTQRPRVGLFFLPNGAGILPRMVHLRRHGRCRQND
ncbi:hypothetical protein M413DRAFT_275859 [Hebeloma cylindrosporum]|uniref:Uncharacterized protein n=1 Tax=Hebeloma cylindrosporum TaxID=76867 RepID=A0A0C2XI24_HEBCY|nr:hypothetical protein M413DRAFT_275859 [Hebeloma cylindrosporum h7]